MMPLFFKRSHWLFFAVLGLGFLPAHAQDNYFITYSHELEEPGNLEIAAKSITGSPKGGDAFAATALELEYGVKTWWSTELYLDGQTTAGQSTVFTGFRWENRVRPLLREHWINPILYFEFENINGADKVLLEVVGHDGRADFLGRNEPQREKTRGRIQADLVQQLQSLERLGKRHRREKSFRLPLGIRLCPGSEPRFGSCRDCGVLHFLPRKLRSGRRNVRRPWRPPQLRPARHLTLRRPSRHLEYP